MHSSTEFYIKIYQNEIENSSCSEYLEKIENLLIREQEIFEIILPQCQSTIKILMSEFDKELIVKFKQTFLQKDTGFIHMLSHKQFEVS